jgi:transcriptional regulator with XRE-family HTH domain
MKLDYSKIRYLQSKHGLSDRAMAKKIGMSNTGYVKMINNHSCSVETLVYISEVFKKPLLYFFEGDTENYSEDPDNVLSCPECQKKNNRINELKLELDNLRLKYIKSLEDLNYKGGESVADSA